MGIFDLFRKKGSSQNLPAVSSDYPEVGMARQKAYISERVRLAKQEGKKLAQPKPKPKTFWDASSFGSFGGGDSTFAPSPAITGKSIKKAKIKHTPQQYKIIKGKAYPIAMQKSAVKKQKQKKPIALIQQPKYDGISPTFRL